MRGDPEGDRPTRPTLLSNVDPSRRLRGRPLLECMHVCSWPSMHWSVALTMSSGPLLTDCWRGVRRKIHPYGSGSFLPFRGSRPETCHAQRSAQRPHVMVLRHGSVAQKTRRRRRLQGVPSCIPLPRIGLAGALYGARTLLACGVLGGLSMPYRASSVGSAEDARQTFECPCLLFGPAASPESQWGLRHSRETRADHLE